MKLAALAAVALATSHASAHYIFIKFGVGSNVGSEYQNIRKNTNMNSPVTDLSSKDLRCNQGGASGASTTVASIAAGGAFTFVTDQPAYHYGPISIFMSKAPGSVQDYAGDGGWFKTLDWGPTGSSNNVVWPMRQTYQANIPSCIPSGEYLLRIQSLGIHNPGSPPQFYISCAQVNVTGGGSTLPSSTVQIPGVFKATDPGYTANIYNQFNPSAYVVPGGSVWKC